MNDLARTWGIWIARGIASVAFGVFTVMRPGASLLALVLVFGIYALVDGAILLTLAAHQEGRARYVVRGLLGVAAGLVAFVYPGLTASSLYVLIGVWAILCGSIELAIAFAVRGEASGVSALVFAGVFSVACGVALLALPLAGVVALAGLIAAYAILNGIVLIVLGLRVRRFFTPQHAI